MSNLVKHAERELALVGMGPDSEDINKAMHDSLIKMVETFAEQGHSGFSGSYAIGILTKLLDFEPLSPLTGEDDEWTDVSGASGKPMWQNNRYSRVFKDETGRAWDIEGLVFRDPDGSTWTNGESHVDVTFPYTPKREYVDRDKDGKTVTPKMPGTTSDGYHTFDELYDHRMALTAALAKTMPKLAWRSKAHHPDGEPMFEGFFIVGIDLPTGTITYHYKLEHWALFSHVGIIPHAPLWDGHTPDDVVRRLKHWVAG